MKILGLLLFLALCFFSAESSAASGKSDLSHIKKIVNRIDRELSACKTKKITNDTLLAGAKSNSSLIGYYKNGSLVKMDIWVGLPPNEITFHLYLAQGKLLFTHLQKVQFPVKNGGNSMDFKHPKVVTDAKLYFQGDRMITKTVTGENLRGVNPNEMLADCRRYAKLLDEKK